MNKKPLLANVKSENLLDTIQKQFIVSITDRTGKIVEINDAFSEISQYSRDELIGENHRIINSRKNPQNLFHEMWKTITAGNSWRGDICNRAKDGSLYWVDSVITPLFDENGQIEFYISIRNDITSRKQHELELEKHEELLERAGLAAAMGGWELDLETNAVYFNNETCRLYGVEKGYKPTIKEALSFYSPESKTLIEETVKRAISDHQDWDMELPFIRLTGEKIWVRSVGTIECVDGKAKKVLGALQDITQQRAQRELIKTTHQRMSLATESGQIGIWEFKLADNSLIWDEWMYRLYGLEPHSVTATYGLWTSNLHPDDKEQVEIAVQDAISNRANFDNEFRVVWPDGSIHFIRGAAKIERDENGTAVRMMGVNWDVTKQRRLTEEVSYQARHDSLTGLKNRAEFERLVQNLLDKAQPKHIEHAIMYIDLDQFKIINDSCGHSVGDIALKNAAELISSIVRHGDVVARIGGDEFAIILEECDTENALKIAQKICDAMERFRFTHGERQFRIGTSIGLVTIDKNWKTTSSVMQAADKSCYAAKDLGRNRVHLYSETDEAIKKRQGQMQWVSVLEKALDEDQFVLYFQPFKPTDIQNNKRYAEILLRLQNESSSIIAPGAFLPAAERFQMSARIDSWVVSHVVQWLTKLTDLQLEEIDLLSLNLSGQSISNDAFRDFTIEFITRLSPKIRQILCLEITETVAITNISDASSFFSKIRALGVKIALDDFGSGSASFGYLKNLDLDILKIDGQFIKDILSEPLDEATVKCFIDVAKVINLKTVAEYVENAEILERLEALGIDFAQGYHIQKPMPLDQFFEKQD